MEAEKRALKRKPLSDCTNTSRNTSLPSTTTSLVKPPKHKPYYVSTQKPNHNSLKSDTNNAPNPTTPPPTSSSNNPGTGDCEEFEPLTIYSRRKTAEVRKNKMKAVATVPLSYPSAERIKNFGDKLNEDGDIGLSKSCPVPRPEHKKKRPHLLKKDASKHALSQDFIDQQIAYFAEIDAFELPEEVVSDGELE